MLDFSTLFVIILLNSLSFAIVWAALSLSYRSLVSARYWLTALTMTCLSGPLLVWGQSNPIVNYLGMTLVAGSFAFYWQGVLLFCGKRPNWNVLGQIMVLSFVTMVVFGGRREVDNIIFAVSQMIPTVLTVGTLLKTPQRYLGHNVTIAAAIIMISGQGSEAGTNLLQIFGVMSVESYYRVAAWFMVGTIVGGGILNLGFLIMTMDSLRDELKQLATHDDLTGLPNRRGFREKLVSCESSMTKSGTSAVLMMIDLDKFKAINDSLGHAAGDAALVHVADIARALIRSGDVVSRLGGDEFCILLPDADVESAADIAARLNATLASTPLFWQGHQVIVSASIGLSEWRSGSSTTLADYLDHADSALLDTKRSGRNGHSIYHSREVAPV